MVTRVLPHSKLAMWDGQASITIILWAAKMAQDKSLIWRDFMCSEPNPDHNKLSRDHPRSPIPRYCVVDFLWYILLSGDKQTMPCKPKPILYNCEFLKSLLYFALWYSCTAQFFFSFYSFSTTMHTLKFIQYIYYYLGTGSKISVLGSVSYDSTTL